MTTQVYHYKILDKATGEMVIPPHKCTVEGVEALGGTIIMGTWQTVARASLEPDGHYMPDKPKPPPT